jgi:hypothetical protein
MIEKQNRPTKVLRIVRSSQPPQLGAADSDYAHMLGQLAIAQSNLIRAKKDSGLSHFIAIVKELERLYGFKFEQVDVNG